MDARKRLDALLLAILTFCSFCHAIARLKLFSTMLKNKAFSQAFRIRPFPIRAMRETLPISQRLYYPGR
jgi:hypothetical protein